MQLSNKHLAFLITLFCTGNIVLGLFLFELKLKDEPIAETLFDLNALTEEEEQLLPKLQTRMASTNTAFDEEQDFKDLMDNFKTINNEAQEEIEDEDDTIDDTNNPNTEDYAQTQPEIKAISNDDKALYNDVNEMVKRLKNNANKQVNANSSMTYSLKNRQILSYKTPRYLCEASGMIVVNVTVNSKGAVTDAYINSTSTSKNQCLIDHALEYASNTKFSAANTASQVGSITYWFKGKD